MSIGVIVEYRTPGREERYWPYLTQRHLVDFIWPLAKSLGLERIEQFEVLTDYDRPENVRAVVTELITIYRYLEDPNSDKRAYPEWEHVMNRTAELIGILQNVLDEWADVKEVGFF